MTTFTPLNDFEIILEQAKVGGLPMQNLLLALVNADLAVPSAAEIMQDGNGFQPLLFPKESVQMLACFTDKARIGEYASLAPYCLVMKGKELLRRIPPDYGLVVNPGASTGFDIAPEGIAKIVSEFV